MRIAITDAREGMKVARDVFSKDGRVLLKAGSLLTESSIRYLKKQGVIAIEIEDRLLSGRKPVRPNSDPVWQEIISEAEHTVRDIWNSVSQGRGIHISRIERIVDSIIQELLQREITYPKLVDIRALDDYTFTHSVNVCVLSLIMGIAKGYSEDELFELGIGSLLHDLGKIIIPPEILGKADTLSAEEMGIVRKHPAYGFSLLVQESEININSSLIAYQHHERYDGSGYPRGLKGDEIHEYAQIVAIVDVYDALTTDRIYRNRIQPYEAVEMLIAMSGRGFNPDYVKLFLKNVEIYPVGSIVELNNGSLGIITGVDKNMPVRPQILLLKWEGERLVPTGDEVDLMKEVTLFITRVIKLDKELLEKVLGNS